MRDVVVVGYGRSAIGKAIKGALKDTHPVDYAGDVLKGVLHQLPNLPADQIEDVVIGCANPERSMGCNMARLIALRAGLPYTVPGMTVNRFCSSGLQTIATAANAIAVGHMDVAVAGGVETMTKETMLFGEEFMNKWLLENEPNAYLPMGITAENVAEKYGIGRRRIDEFSAESHQRAARAQAEGKFRKEIIPVTAVAEDGSAFTFDTDQGVRGDSSADVLGGLKTSFKEDGVVTAGNSSQLSDGAGMVALMAAEKAAKLGIRPIARFVGYAVTGVDPAIMGIGPIKAIPKVMEKTGLTIGQMDVIELNEAFGAQALACIDELKLDTAKVNPNGGAIALGHPLGATGAILTCKALAELRRTGGKYALISMCIGGGMGAAGIYEML